ncbi:MAG: N-acetyltransferase protein [Patescibacteria group bacterium]|nr:N-acetyltransferase protein [Patescibacteria group bacterium]
MERIVCLAGKIVSLGLLVIEDVEILTRWINQEEMREYLSTYLPMYASQEKEWIEKLPSRMPNDFVFGIIDNETKTLLGNIGLHRVKQKDGLAHAGIFIGDRQNRKKGVATEAGQLLLKYAFGTLNLRKVVHEAFAHNKASIALGKKLGAKQEGVMKSHLFINGRYVDVVIMSYFRPGCEPKD